MYTIDKLANASTNPLINQTLSNNITTLDIFNKTIGVANETINKAIVEINAPINKTPKTINLTNILTDNNTTNLNLINNKLIPIDSNLRNITPITTVLLTPIIPTLLPNVFSDLVNKTVLPINNPIKLNITPLINNLNSILTTSTINSSLPININMSSFLQTKTRSPINASNNIVTNNTKTSSSVWQSIENATQLLTTEASSLINKVINDINGTIQDIKNQFNSINTPNLFYQTIAEVNQYINNIKNSLIQVQTKLESLLVNATSLRNYNTTFPPNISILSVSNNSIKPSIMPTSNFSINPISNVSIIPKHDQIINTSKF